MKKSKKKTISFWVLVFSFTYPMDLTKGKENIKKGPLDRLLSLALHIACPVLGLGKATLCSPKKNHSTIECFHFVKVSEKWWFSLNPFFLFFSHLQNLNLTCLENPQTEWQKWFNFLVMILVDTLSQLGTLLRKKQMFFVRPAREKASATEVKRKPAMSYTCTTFC